MMATIICGDNNYNNFTDCRYQINKVRHSVLSTTADSHIRLITPVV